MILLVFLLFACFFNETKENNQRTALVKQGISCKTFDDQVVFFDDRMIKKSELLQEYTQELFALHTTLSHSFEFKKSKHKKEKKVLAPFDVPFNQKTINLYRRYAHDSLQAGEIKRLKSLELLSLYVLTDYLRVKNDNLASQVPSLLSKLSYNQYCSLSITERQALLKRCCYDELSFLKSFAQLESLNVLAENKVWYFGNDLTSGVYSRFYSPNVITLHEAKSGEETGCIDLKTALKVSCLKGLRTTHDADCFIVLIADKEPSICSRCLVVNPLAYKYKIFSDIMLPFRELKSVIATPKGELYYLAFTSDSIRTGLRCYYNQGEKSSQFFSLFYYDNHPFIHKSFLKKDNNGYVNAVVFLTDGIDSYRINRGSMFAEYHQSLSGYEPLFGSHNASYIVTYRDNFFMNFDKCLYECVHSTPFKKELSDECCFNHSGTLFAFLPAKKLSRIALAETYSGNVVTSLPIPKNVYGIERMYFQNNVLVIGALCSKNKNKTRKKTFVYDASTLDYILGARDKQGQLSMSIEEFDSLWQPAKDLV